MEKITLIIPVYNEEQALPIFYDAVSKVSDTLKDAQTELLFVNDGSEDGSLEAIRKLAQQDSRVKYLSFSRNFGKEAAMYAGFCNATGDYVAVMDADLQDPPELLPQMLEILRSGSYDSVATRRASRKGEPALRSWFAEKFYSILNRISDADVVDGARDFRLMRREMVDAIIAMGENNRFSKGIFGWVGFRTYWLPFENVERAAGQTKWSFWKLVRYAIDGIIDFSETPLSMVSWMGVLMTGVSLAFIVLIIIRKLIFGDPVAGWPSTICIILFVGGIQMFGLGVIGQYTAKIYKEVKNRPHFIISDSNLENVRKIG